ncbi:ABC transporter ATP-binding protein [Kocuria sp. cx-116]|uniref:ABC transporter ATP-binding protein n=1 Tax=Kocuria sp. cx-116 TaxID=2771378 RepID=UPI0016864A6E|nr:ABC transporter ATP-binding protein [Kocuria sp. cx-116]MBD2761243.1 ABC transporter ATP-binding protein [Kocuria sp. cx-116]
MKLSDHSLIDAGDTTGKSSATTPPATSAPRGQTVPGAVSLQIRNLRADYGAGPVLSEISLDIPRGVVTVLVGANGCGKSTLLKTIARQLKPSHGEVLLDGEDTGRWSRTQFARRVGFLPQDPVAPEGVTVLDLISRGRHPHRGAFGRWRASDDRAVAEAVELTGLHSYLDRQVTELSGGQRQRVWIALSLAQQTDVLLLDEPTTYLDIAHQVEVLDILADLQRRRGITLVMVLHELNMAARYADQLVAIKSGTVLASGTAEEVMTDHTVSEVFGMSARVLHDPESDTRLVVPARTHRAAQPAPATHAPSAVEKGMNV